MSGSLYNPALHQEIQIVVFVHIGDFTLIIGEAVFQLRGGLVLVHVDPPMPVNANGLIIPEQPFKVHRCRWIEILL